MPVVNIWLGKGDKDIKDYIAQRLKEGASRSEILKELMRDGLRKSNAKQIEKKIDQVLEKLNKG